MSLKNQKAFDQLISMHAEEYSKLACHSHEAWQQEFHEESDSVGLLIDASDGNNGLRERNKNDLLHADNLC